MKFAVITALSALSIFCVAMNACKSSRHSPGMSPAGTADLKAPQTAPSDSAVVIDGPEPVCIPQEVVTGQPPVQALPKAVIYKTNVDVADHVAVMLSADGKTLLSFPDPSDITPTSTPLRLDSGWLLDRRGAIGPGTAFLSYTYAQYARMNQAPTPQQILNAIIPGAHVTATHRLDMTPSDAAANPTAINTLIAAGLPYSPANPDTPSLPTDTP